MSSNFQAPGNLHSLERADGRLHLDPDFLHHRICSGLLILRARRLPALDSKEQFHNCIVNARAFGGSRRNLERRQSSGQHDAVGAFQDSFSPGLRWNPDGALQRPR